MTARLWKGLYLVKLTILVCVGFLALGSPSVSAFQTPSPFSTVTTFFDDWNKGDIRAASKLFDSEPCITDVFPRFHWQGRNAFRDWFSDFYIYNLNQGFTDYFFDVGEPQPIDVEGPLAQVIVPVVIDLKHNGQPEAYPGLVNIVLRRDLTAWKITSFTWTSD